MVRFGLLCAFLLLPQAVWAQSLSLDLGEAVDGQASGRLVQLLALLTVLSLAPSILIMVTAFARIIIVLSLLRTALGLQQTPPNSVLVGLALFLTLFVMAPTFQAAYDQGVAPLIAEKIKEEEAFEKTVAPFKTFMLSHVREQDLRLFMDLGKIDAVSSPEATPLRALIPAFMISELKRAFEIGFMIFLPFVIIDLVVASILMALGMMMLPPVTVSVPFKLIFFVLIDGWYLLSGSLVRGFG
ncbi:MAG: flagellar type III secretion system pore protein FliP [Alphaproteobacteria bacterium]|jgi:flagellar biosynthetic protein FliP|nr:flagellar type III secretion system pore protein FliP [Alphaproteobacteria bacterium]